MAYDHDQEKIESEKIWTSSTTDAAAIVIQYKAWMVRWQTEKAARWETNPGSSENVLHDEFKEVLLDWHIAERQSVLLELRELNKMLERARTNGENVTEEQEQWRKTLQARVDAEQLLFGPPSSLGAPTSVASSQPLASGSETGAGTGPS